jgi:hypothetical protein
VKAQAAGKAAEYRESAQAGVRWGGSAPPAEAASSASQTQRANQISAVVRMRQLVRRRLDHADQRRRDVTTARECAHRAAASSCRCRHVDRQRLLPPGHRQVDLGQQLGIEQRPMQRTVRVVDSEAFAQRVEAVARPRKRLARER